MLKRWRQSIRRKINSVRLTIRRWFFYTKMIFLFLLIITVLLLLTWLLTLVNSVDQRIAPEITPPEQTTRSDVPESTEPPPPPPPSESPSSPPGPTPSPPSAPSMAEDEADSPTDEEVSVDPDEYASPSQTEAESNSEGDFVEFTITAYPERIQIDDQLSVDAWTYNGTFPGPIIRVKEGQRVRIVFRNQVPGIGTALHWHGIPTRNSMDGVPTVTQPYVNYGEEFVYEFPAEPAGTYSYHAHSFGNDVTQLDKGLYAPFIIEESDDEQTFPEANTEWVVSVDEMQIPGEGNPPPATDGNRMDQSMMKQMMPGALLGSADPYNVFLMNGKRNPVHVFEANVGEWVRLRLLNFGYQTHRIQVTGMQMYATHTDGHALPGAQPVDYMEISPYERADAYLIGNESGTFELLDIDPGHSEFGMSAQVVLTANDNQKKTDAEPLEIAQIPANAPRYQGISAGIPGTDDTQYDRTYGMTIGMTMSSDGMAWAINGKTWTSFEEVDPYEVKQGETIKVDLFNMTPESHPMHLHGHPFRVVAIDGQTLSEPWILKDTINVRPMQRLSIAFEADNPGDWIFHCHQAHHADSGLETYFTYVE